MLGSRYNNLDELYHSKSEEGLSRLLAFLREEEERERLELIERLKPIGTQVHSQSTGCARLQLPAFTFHDFLPAFVFVHCAEVLA